MSYINEFYLLIY